MRTKAYALKYFSFDVREGRYNLMDPSEVTVRVFVRWGSGKHRQANFHFSPEDVYFYEDDYPAEQLKELAEAWLAVPRISTSHSEVQAFLDWISIEGDEDDGFSSNVNYFDWPWAYRRVLSEGRSLAVRQERIRRMRSFVTSVIGEAQ